jgi:hypothetical protein
MEAHSTRSQTSTETTGKVGSIFSMCESRFNVAWKYLFSRLSTLAFMDTMYRRPEFSTQEFLESSVVIILCICIHTGTPVIEVLLLFITPHSTASPNSIACTAAFFKKVDPASLSVSPFPGENAKNVINDKTQKRTIKTPQ